MKETEERISYPGHVDDELAIQATEVINVLREHGENSAITDYIANLITSSEVRGRRQAFDAMRRRAFDRSEDGAAKG